MRLTEGDIKKRRERIIQNAFRMFCERGIEAISLTEISRKSQVSENTIYRYFKSKENLVLEAFIRVWDTIMSGVEQKVEGTGRYSELSGFGQIRAWIEGFRELYIEKREFILFSYEAKLYLLRHKIKLDRGQQDLLMQAIRGVCLAALDKGKKDGSIPVGRNSEDLFYAIWGSIRGYIVKIVMYDQLYEEYSPWESRYQVMEEGILSALSTGWRTPESGQIFSEKE